MKIKVIELLRIVDQFYQIRKSNRKIMDEGEPENMDMQAFTFSAIIIKI